MINFKKKYLLVPIILIIIGCCAPVKDMVLVDGGTIRKEDKNGETEQINIQKYYIGIYEVTQKLWKEVMGDNPSYFKGDDLPVENISWYDAVIFCNRLSKMEGLAECYTINELDTDSTDLYVNHRIKYEIKLNLGKNGYRLPTITEWEYAYTGGRSSRGLKYSGSDKIDEVGWHKRNSGDKILNTFNETAYFSEDSLKVYNNSTKPVGSKKPNELGIYDMTGNVNEYRWDFKDYHYADYQIELGDQFYGRDVHVHLRSAAGGSWMDDILGSEKAVEILLAPYLKDRSCGLRVVRKAGCIFN